MKIRNPKFARAPHPAQPAVQAHIAALDAGDEFLTFDAIRQAVPALAGADDGTVFQILSDLGHEVDQ